MKEPLVTFVIFITLPSGQVTREQQKGVTNWHAVDKSYNQNSHRQDDRKKYLAMPTLTCKN